MFITTNEVLVDWFTFTTFNARVFWEITDYLQDLDNFEETKQTGVMQYRGFISKTDSGTVFAGQARQKGRDHYMIRASGELADYLLPITYKPLLSGNGRVTRLDVQLTIDEPPDWNQWKLFNRLKKVGKNMGWVESQATRKGNQAVSLATVYVNSRKSERFCRVYEKMTEGWSKLLRLEVELKGDVSGAVARRLAMSSPDKRHDIKSAEVRRYAQLDEKLQIHFDVYLSGKIKPVKVKAASGDTGRWIVDTCIPSIVKYLNQHDGDRKQEILDEIAILYDAYIVDILSESV